MKEKSRSKAPDTFAGYVGTLANQLVRVALSSGEKRDGVLVVHADYVTFEGQQGGFAIAHIAGIAPLAMQSPDQPHAHSS